MTTIKLVDNLGGVVGCDYLLSKNQLFFVEFAKGLLSTIAPGYSPIKQNAIALAPKRAVDLDKSVGLPLPDLGVRDVGAGFPNMYTMGGAKVHVLSAGEHPAPEKLPYLSYSVNQSPGFTGKNFVILTNSGNYSVVEVETDKILMDSDVERNITSDTPLKLEEGYMLAIKSIDIDGNKLYLELAKNGVVVDGKVISPSKTGATEADKTYYYKNTTVGGQKKLVTIRVHFKNAFRGADQVIASIDRIWQIPDGSKIYIKYTTYAKKHGYQTLGYNYQEPEDIVVTSNGLYAYVAERTGNLLRVNLNQSNANRDTATVIISGLEEPHQIALDENRNLAYLVEFGSGKLASIDLGGKSKTDLISNLERPTGLLMSRDFQYAYVTEQTLGTDGGRLSRITLNTGNREVLVKGLTNPFFMTWADSSESCIFLTERAPANRVKIVDLKTIVDQKNATVIATQFASMPAQPSGVAIALSSSLLVCCDNEIDQIKLDEKYFNISEPLLMGIGFVPFDHIPDGYADTTSETDYFFQVVDAPFGGNLPIMFNHERAREVNKASYYSISFDDIVQMQSWSDYRWDPVTNTFVLTPAEKSDDKTKFKVRKANDLWYNSWLGGFIDTTVLLDGQHTIGIKVFDDNFKPLETATLKVQIDNQWPHAVIEKIFYYYDPEDPSKRREIPVCGIAQGDDDEFSFQIEATDPVSNHLLSWYLSAMWGDNKSAIVSSGSYDKNTAKPKHKWEGVLHKEVPSPSPTGHYWHASVQGDNSSKQCAHTFYLGVWDRVINGWGYIHYRDYHKSVTILVK